MRLLAMDVGLGTQDVLVYDGGRRVENMVKMVLPSPTMLVASRIRRHTRRNEDIFLTGTTMGGGPNVGAIRDHLSKGLKVYATPAAARTIRDDLEQVMAMGVQIVEEPPAGATPIVMRDVDLDAMKVALSAFEIEAPDKFAVAVQDHGYEPGVSDRVTRFEHLRRGIDAGGDLDSFAYWDPPHYLTRMMAIREQLGEVLLMDTGIAAIRGALLVTEADPALVVNVGNGHTLGAIVRGGRITAIFEHHTSMLNTAKLGDLIFRLAEGTLTFDDVYKDGGHGAHVRTAPGMSQIEETLITGPQREIAQGLGRFAAPYGDMMLTGCYGLMDAFLSRS